MIDIPVPGGPGLPISAFRLAVLLLLAAAGYALAIYGMKLYSLAAAPIPVGVIGVGIALAVLSEVAILRRMDLSTGYLLIISVETFLVLLAALALGEVLDARKLLGAVLVVLGLVLVH